MKHFKYKKILFPPLWILIILTLVSTIALVGVFVKGLELSLIAYIIYGVSTYTLIVICLACWKTIPNYYKRMKEIVYSNKYANHYLTDVPFKTHINLYRSLIINLLYVAINAISGIIYHTYWFGIFAVYYAIMAVMRFLLIRYVDWNQIGKNRIRELKCSRICSYILMTVNLALSGAVLMMVYYNRGFEYQGFLIYVMATYTFYITAAAIRDMLKYRKYDSPVMSVSMTIKMASALFSMLFLETAMFAQFGSTESAEKKQMMIMLTGAGVSIIVVVMSVYMIVRSTAEIKKIKINSSCK